MYSLFRHGEQLFMVMEFVQGPTVDMLIREAGRMTLDQAIPIFLQALDGVEHAHRMGIIHRDLKPANIMVNRDGLVKVTDFGIARVLGAARMTREGAMIGTLEYMSPERVLGKELDARSDLYSLGFVLYEMLTGNLPFSSQTEYEILKAQIETPPPPVRISVPEVPPEIETAILKAMAKNPDDRYLTAGAFAMALRLAMGISMEFPTRSFPTADAIPVETAPRAPAGETRLLDSVPPLQTPAEPAANPNPALAPDPGFIPGPAALFDAGPDSALEPVPLPEPVRERSQPIPLKYYWWGLGALAAVVLVALLIVMSRSAPQTGVTTEPVTVPAPPPAVTTTPVPVPQPPKKIETQPPVHVTEKATPKAKAETKEPDNDDDLHKSIDELMGVKKKPEQK
jgi:serine/threonine-protein kinase